jgi:hypothetical protein
LFFEAEKMISDGLFLVERFNFLEQFLKASPRDINLVVASIAEKVKTYSVAFLCQECCRLKVLERDAYKLLETINIMIVTTADTIYKIKEVEADLVNLNATIGY